MLAPAATVNDQRSQKLPPLPALTSVRYFLAFVVVLVHYHCVLAPQLGDSRTLGWLATVAVTAFFVLSGFILTYQYWKPGQVLDKSRFYVARIARIVPVCWFSLVVALLLKTSAQLPQGAWLAASAGASAAFIQSWIPNDPVYFGINPPAYTLSIEAFFYTLFPLVIGFFARRLVLGVLLSLIASFSVVLLPPGYLPWGVFILPIGRVSEFAFGVASGLLFMRWRERAASWSARKVTVLELTSLGLVIAFAGITAATCSFPVTHWYDCVLKSTVAFLISIAFFALALNRGVVAKLWSRAPLVVLGEVSYSLYLLHDVFIRFLAAQELKVQWNNPLLFVAVAIGSTFLSYLCFKFVEVPWRAKILSWKATRVRPWIWAQAAVVALLLLGRGLAETSWWRMLREANSKSVVAQSVTFEDGATLDRMYISKVSNALEIATYWRTGTNPARARRIGVHVLNEKSEIVRQYDHDLMPAMLPLSGTEVVDRVQISAADLPPHARVGIALYDDPQQTLSASEGTCDWGGHRLLIPLKNVGGQ